jgi:dynein heavy chain
LIIDPQIQACKWIKNMEAENKIQVCKETSDNLQKIIEDCITQGMPLLIEDLGETLPSILDPIYQK